MKIAVPAVICDAIQWDLRSEVRGRTFRIYVFKPVEPPPPSGYPVVYVTDGNLCFGTAAMQARVVDRPEDVSPAMVVGIGYPVREAEEYRLRRIHDFTFEEPAEEQKAEAMESSRLQRISYGGADDFYRFITEQLIPTLSESYEIDKSNQALFGDSFGGLFVLYVLFRHPSSFRTFVAGSPAISWNNKAVLRDLPGFARVVEAGEAVPRVLITVGSREQSTEGLRIPSHMTRDKFVSLVNKARMIDNARELAGSLGLIKGRHGYRVEFTMFEGETHGSAIAATISRAISFAM